MILNSKQFRSLTSNSYEYNSRTRTIADVSWKKISKNWFEIFHFVKLFRMQLSNQNEYIDQIRSWHFAMQNLFIINRFEHFESKESIDFIIYSQNRIFDVFVRIHRSENTISHKTQFEQWARIDSVLSKIEDICRIANRNYTNHEFDEHAICSLNIK